MNYEQFLTHLHVLSDCTVCPRNCHVNRFESSGGFCRSGAGFGISSICIHMGEEPVISGKDGICNVFFSHCNLKCIYCQNHQISRNNKDNLPSVEFPEVVTQITAILDKGIRRVGFVSPSHFVPHMMAIIDAIESLGYEPVWIYNTNGYDKVDTLKKLEGIIDVYLPDLKYLDPALAKEYSGTEDYPEVAIAALKEMFRQKGSALITDDEGCAESGIIIRHLVLPGNVKNSLNVLNFIAEELSSRLHISLMSQYYPTPAVSDHPVLGRHLKPEEYDEVTSLMESLGLCKGWIQELDSNSYYKPDFNKDHPFEL